MEWIKPQNMSAGEATQQETLTFDMLRALIAARQAALPHTLTMHGPRATVANVEPGGDTVRRIFAAGVKDASATGQFADYHGSTGKALSNASKVGQNDA